MSIIVKVGGTQITVEAIEYRPVEGLVWRVANNLQEGIVDVGEALSGVLRGSAYRIYRTCCDSAPVGEEAHADGCENATKRGKGR